MEITLLGKRLEDYPKTAFFEEELIRTTFNLEFREHNIRAIRHRLDDGFEHEVMDLFVMSGNAFNTTDKIIAATRVIMSLNILTQEEWSKAIPIIERGLEANKAYVKMLDEMSVIFERYCSDWEDVNMGFTFMERVPLECWQGRFCFHTSNPNKEPNYF